MRDKKIDLIKAFLFVLFTVIMSAGLIFMLFIPDIKSMKRVHMERDRILLLLDQAKRENEAKIIALNKTEENNKRAMEILQNKFLPSKFHSEISKHFSQVELKEIKADQLEQFETKEFAVTALLKDPNNFYDFIDSLANTSYATGVDFPISIKADEEFNLELDFLIKSHNTK